MVINVLVPKLQNSAALILYLFFKWKYKIKVRTEVIFILARTYLQLQLQQWGAGNVYLLVLSSIAENPIAVVDTFRPANLVAQMAKTVKFIFSNLVYIPTVYKTGVWIKPAQ